MKKSFIAFSLAAVMLAGLAGCGRIAEPPRELDGIRKPKETAQVTNDTLYNVSAEKVMEVSGISFFIPENNADVTYNIYDPKSEAPVVELLYNLTRKNSTAKTPMMVRAAKTGIESLGPAQAAEYNISGMYYNYAAPAEMYVDQYTAYALISSEATYVSWLEGNVLYSLCFRGLYDTEQLQKQIDSVYPVPEPEEEFEFVEDAGIPAFSENEDLRNEIEALLEDIWNAAPGTAGSSLRTAAAAAELMDFTMKYLGDFNSINLTATVRNWLDNRFEGNANLVEQFAQSLSAVGDRIGAFLLNPESMDEGLLDCGYARRYEEYNADFVQYVLECIGDALN